MKRKYCYSLVVIFSAFLFSCKSSANELANSECCGTQFFSLTLPAQWTKTYTPTEFVPTFTISVQLADYPLAPDLVWVVKETGLHEFVLFEEKINIFARHYLAECKENIVETHIHFYSTENMNDMGWVVVGIGRQSQVYYKYPKTYLEVSTGLVEDDDDRKYCISIWRSLQ